MTVQKNVRTLSHSDGELQQDHRPIVLNYKKWKKKTEDQSQEGKPRYSPGLEDAQRMEGDAVEIAQKSARALSKSLDAYHAAREKSARKKKDGAIEDFVNNSAKAASTFLKEASDIPVDVADSMSRSKLRKNLRKGLRQAARRIGKWPI